MRTKTPKFYLVFDYLHAAFDFEERFPGATAHHNSKGVAFCECIYKEGRLEACLNNIRPYEKIYKITGYFADKNLSIAI